MRVMEVRMRVAVLAFSLFCVVATVGAQTVIPPPPPAKAVSLSGPRFGVTSLSDGVVAKLQERSIDVRPMITQFGWQFERQFYSQNSGVAAVNEWVVLVGGLDDGVVLPSLTWLVGLRTKEGTEVGVGPNVTPVGVALAFAAGVTLRAGIMNVPMNLAVVPSKAGMRVSFLTGFNMRRQ
jgi:hypothetical protein